MSTPPTPDEEFDALFRKGLEHYPEQPQFPAAWHRMELLLEADLRQQALRRRLLRLLGAEALLLLVGMWALLSFVLQQVPATAANQPLLASAGQAMAPRRAGTPAAMKQPAPAPAAGSAPVNAGPASATTESAVAATASSPKENTLVGSPAALAAPAGTSTRAQQRRALLAVAAAPLRHARRAQAARRVDKHVASLGPAAGAERQRGARYVPGSHERAQLLPGSSSSRPALLSAAGQLVADAQGIKYARRGFAAPARQRFRAAKQAEAAAGRGAVAAVALPRRPRPAVASSLQAGQGAARRRAAHQEEIGYSAAAASRPAALPTEPPTELLALRQFASRFGWSLPDSLALGALPAPIRPADSLPRRPLLSAYRLRVGLVAAPELSTVRADRLTTPGSNLGVQLDYQLARRWRLSTGYLYTVKNYVARGSDYHLPAGYIIPNNWVISNVDAACQIIDIPLNVRYDVWQRPRYQVFASAGLSSLLMRREQYTYDYEPANGQPVPAYTWALRNGSQHVLKVLNLSVGYERALGQRWSLQAEPFVKLPLAGVGFGAVRLSSAGVFFSLKYGLLPVRQAPALR